MNGVDMLHGRTSDHLAVACAFDPTICDGGRFVSASWLSANF